MLRRLYNLAEAAVLWTTHEAPRLLAARLTPRLRTKSHVVSTVSAHGSPYSSRIAVLVLFPEHEIADDIVALTRTLTDAGCSVVLVANRPLSPQDLGRLDGTYHTLHVRRNVGRDFGAYKDAIVPLLDEPSLERLIVLNDSCHYLEGNLKGFVEELLGPQDLIGSHENFDPPYHLGSFALSFSGRVVRSASFRNFWINYLPVSTRRWAILRGEMGVTRATVLAGYRPHVIYSSDRLYKALLTAPQGEVEDALALLPRGPARTAATDLVMRANFSPDKTAGLATFTKARLIESIMHAVTQGSQVHHGAFLFARFLGSPLIKKDLLLRGVFSPDQLYLASLRVPLPEVVMAAARARASTPRGSWLTRRLRARGLI